MTNYGGIPKKFSDLKNSKVVILPVPYDVPAHGLKEPIRDQMQF